MGKNNQLLTLTVSTDTVLEKLAEASQRIAELEQARTWIPVRKELPEKDSVEVWEMYEVVMYFFGSPCVAALYFIGGGWYNGNGYDYTNFVVAWRNLPEVPDIDTINQWRFDNEI